MRDDLFQRGEHLLALMMTSVWSAADVVRHLLAYFRSMASSLMPMAKVRMGLPSFLAAMAHTRLESRAAGKQEADRGVGVQPLFHAGDELLADVGQGGVHIVLS